MLYTAYNTYKAMYNHPIFGDSVNTPPATVTRYKNKTPAKISVLGINSSVVTVK